MARTRSLKIDRWIKRHENKHLCKCGCGQYIEIQRIHYRSGIPGFIKGHNFDSFNPSKGLEVPKDLPIWETLSDEEKDKRLLNLKSFPRGEEHPNWSGGEIITESGYRLIKVYEHPFNASGYLQEHRLIVEEHMQKNFPNHEFMETIDDIPYLKKSVIIHHRNEVKTCNDLENLICMRNQGVHFGWHQRKINEEEKLKRYEKDIFCPWIKEPHGR